MSENNEKVKSVTYIKNGQYLFNIIKIIPHSPTNIEKIGITIYKKTLEINILNKDSIELLLNTNSNPKFVESYANIGFVKLYDILCFIFVMNNDIKEKEKIMVGNNKSPYKIYRIDNIRCFPVTYYIPPEINNIVKDEFVKMGKFFVSEQLFFSNFPFRFDFDISNQLKVFEDNNYKYKLFEKFQYNEDFSLKLYEHFLTPIVKGFYKHISYNNLFNDKDRVNVSIRYKLNGKNKYLIEVEMFITPLTNQKYFQNIFYAYSNDSNEKITDLKKIIDNWNNDNNLNKNKNEGVIINCFCNEEDNKNNDFIEEIKQFKNFELINIDLNVKHSKDDDFDKILNPNLETLKSVGYNYKYNNIDYNSQNKLLIIVGTDYEKLFSFIKIVAYKMYSIFLNDRGYQKNIISNAKDEIIKNFKLFEKQIQMFKKKFPERLNVEFVKDIKELKNSAYHENDDLKIAYNFNFNCKEFIMADSEKKEENDFVIVDSLDSYDKNNKIDYHEIDDNNNNNNNNDINNEKDNNNIDEKNIIEEDNKNNINENCNIEEYNNEYEDNNNENENEINLIDNDIYENNNNDENNEIVDNNENNNNIKENNNINNKIIPNNIINSTIKKNAITIFIGTFNVNALESDLIKKTNLDSFLFPEKLKNYFNPENIPTFYCIGLEETIELNPKNVLIKPKNKAELWEERISEELQKKYNYLLQCKEQLVGVLLLFFVKATEIKYITNIHIDKLKLGFMGCGNKGCCFFDFEYKKYSFGFCSCHLPAGQNKKNYLDRKETFKHILEFKVNKNIYEFYKNDFFFIFGDLNFRTKKIGLVDLQNHIKIIIGEQKYGKKKKNFRFSLEYIDKKNKNKEKEKEKENNNIDKKKRRDLKSDNLYDVNIPDNLPNEKNMETSKHNKSNNKSIDKKIKKNKNKEDKDYNNYYTNNNKGNEIKQCNMDENTFSHYFFKEFIEDEELKKLKEHELFLYDVNEAEITFPPTYKYIKGTNFYNLSKRVPSWTDRILYKNVKQITPIYYDRIYINFSDHKPIVGLFEINIDE